MGLLDGQTAIITGAASPRGLGKATARLFAEHGCRVAILDLDIGQAEEAAADAGDDLGYGDVFQGREFGQQVVVLVNEADVQAAQPGTGVVVHIAGSLARDRHLA